MENCFFEHVYGCNKNDSTLTTASTTRLETILRSSREYLDEIYMELSEMLCNNDTLIIMTIKGHAKCVN